MVYMYTVMLVGRTNLKSREKKMDRLKEIRDKLWLTLGRGKETILLLADKRKSPTHYVIKAWVQPCHFRL